MTGPARIQRQRTKGWKMPADAVYVGRPTRWGNPFAVRRVSPWPRWGGPAPWQIVTPDDRVWEHEESRKPIVGRAEADANRYAIAVAAAVDLFRTHIGPMGNYEYDAATLVDLRDALAGRDLVCWCPVGTPCHADVLMEIANA